MTKISNSETIFSKAFSFIKENLSIVYSLLLVILIPAGFLINNYFINSRYEDAIDKITQRKAVLAENVINNFIQNRISDPAAIQASVEKIMKENDEITSLSILVPESEGFRVLASNDTNIVGEKQDANLQNLVAWGTSEPIAFLDKGNAGRFWNVTKLLFNESNQKIGLIKMSLSLEDSDILVNNVISDSYWILILTILIVVLLVANQARLLGYALTVTKLKEVDKMKDMFIAMASHELRTPLSAISGYLEILKEKKELVLDEDANHSMKNMSLSVKRLDNLVEDILEVSRIQGNRLPMEITVFNPSDVISQSIDEIRPRALQKNLALNYKPFPGQIQIRADESRLKQVLINLIDNAIKYTQKGGVEVSAAVKNDDFLITVADTGIGISSEDQAKLFQKFQRIKNKNTMDIIGTGLGLWISFEIVKRMQGKIAVESIEGVGSHFTIHLPTAKK